VRYLLDRQKRTAALIGAAWAAGLMLHAPPVQADWEEVHETRPADQFTPAVTQAMLDARFEGSTVTRHRGGTPQQGGFHEVFPNSNIKLDYDDLFGGRFVIDETLFSSRYGHALSVEKTFNMRKLYRWVPRMIQISDENGNTIYGPDPEDTPPALLKVKVGVDASVHAYSDLNGERDAPLLDEVVSASVLGITATPQNSAEEHTTGRKAEIPTTYRLMQKATNGNYLVYTEPVTYVLSAAVPGGRKFEKQYPWSSTPEEITPAGKVWAGGGYSAQLDTRAVWVSSGIEPSYYKKHLSGIPSDVIKDLNKRNADGSITVDSAAEWYGWPKGNPPGSNPTWMGAPNEIFRTHLPGFSYGDVEWQISGGAPHGLILGDKIWKVDTNGDGYKSGNNEYNFTNRQGGDAFPFNGIELGGDVKGDGMVRSTTFKVKATDEDGVAGENTYVVNWHLPLENAMQDTSRPTAEGTDYDTAASSVVNMNDPVTVTIQPARIEWSIAGGGAGLLAGLAGVWPGGTVGAVISLALTAAGMAIVSDAPETVTWPTTFSYDKYANAITRQYEINQGAAGTESSLSGFNQCRNCC
jgi:hypothetical protein